ncbi:MAG: ABC transporter permease [Anaerolineae bacterium]|nr:ABC transporter permease [Anaerolineae bacterium]MDW8099738.1 ABC transporter permease [Anaerolineae bacterium]
MAAPANRLLNFWRYTRRNPTLGAGLALLLFLLLFAGVGALLVDPQKAYPLAAPPNKPPSLEYPLGTDSQGRDLLVAMIVGTRLTLRIGLIAGAIGLGVGTILGFLAAFYGGVLDTIIRWIVDVLLTVPGLLVLVVIASSLKREMTVEGMALVVALLAWMWPTRTIRAQVLTLRERPFVMMARLSGMSGPEIIVKELMPNLLPYLAASFVGSVASAILASIGLEALGLGPMREPTLGMTIYWVIYYSAFLRGLWWWGLSPITVIVILFVGLFLLAAGLDELANPRVRRAA